MRKNELSYKSLKNIYNPNNFKFETTMIWIVKI